MPNSPDHVVDIAIVGGGITGCAALWYLATGGADALLIETAELNTEASGSNSGSLHAQIPQDTFLDLGEDWADGFLPTVRLLRASIELWQAADAAHAGALEVRLGGGLMLASSDRELRNIERKARFDRAAGSAYEFLGADELRRRAPFLSSHLVGAGYCPGEGKANPLVAAPTLARSAIAAGARILSQRRVENITRAAQGYRLRAGGESIDARRVVIAAGAGSPRIAGVAPLARLPIQSVPIQVAVTEPLEPLISPLLYYARAPLTMKQTSAGTVVIGGGWPAKFDRLQRPVPDARSLAQNLGLALEVMPRLADVSIVRSWAATVNGTPDWKPMIGEIPGAAGMYLAYVPWMGFTGGLAAARIAASLALGHAPGDAIALSTEDIASFALA
ncbi:MAG: FAD-dependent oxidoreductase [Halieaceae bacterium]|jgi:glycine/D-amino acid oxidase-like deaminating enzyme|nr:FAD-dependent oxidoreductase [Halieaceae bacterium]